MVLLEECINEKNLFVNRNFVHCTNFQKKPGRIDNAPPLLSFGKMQSLFDCTPLFSDFGTLPAMAPSPTTGGN
jgi:hypothetical protein